VFFNALGLLSVPIIVKLIWIAFFDEKIIRMLTATARLCELAEPNTSSYKRLCYKNNKKYEGCPIFNFLYIALHAEYSR
jgi:hypothetical protein